MAQEGEQTWLLAGQLGAGGLAGAARSGDAEEGAAGAAPGDERHDVPAESLADADSLFLDCQGLKVHYKMALPLVRVCVEGPGRAGAAAAMQ